MKIISVISLLNSIITVHGFRSEPNWTNYLIKDIEKNLKISQAVIIIDDKSDIKTIKIESIIRKFQSKMPIKVIGLNNATLTRANILLQEKLSGDLHDTTLLITILLLKNNLRNESIVNSTKFLTELTAPRTRPKCLMILFREKEGLSFKQVLRNMWTKNFLDFTIFEVIEKRLGNNYQLWTRPENIAMVHFLNPFTGIYSKIKYESKVKIFPNKLRDLKGFQMKVGSFNYTPYVDVKRNSSGHPISVTGPEASVVKALSKAMNFKISEVPSQKEWWGRFSCTNASIATGFLGKLRDNEIRFITNHGKLNYDCIVEYSRSTGTLSYNALILNVKYTHKSVSFSMKWFYLIVLIVPIWLVSRLLNFNKHYWSLIDIIQAMLGFVIPQEPQKSAERIVFGTVLIAFTVFSTTLFAILTDIEITEEDDMSINTLEDLNKSNLIPTMPTIFYTILKKDSDGIVEALLNKSSTKVYREKCLKMLLDHKNITCIDREQSAEMIISNYLTEDGQPLMKIIKQTLGQYQKCMLFEKNSPFVRAANKILIKLQESGLNNKWYKPQLRRIIKSEESIIREEEKSVKLIIPLLIVLAIGYGVSVMVFIIELLRAYIENVVFRCISVALQNHTIFDKIKKDFDLENVLPHLNYYSNIDVV